MSLTQEKCEQLILRALDELGISGRIIVTFDVHEELAVWCSTVSTLNGLKHVYIDFDREIDEILVMFEIKRQLTAADATRKAKRDAKIEELKSRARNIVEQARREERQKRGECLCDFP